VSDAQNPLWNRVVWIASWVLPPALMAVAYTVLALTSETDRSGDAWMAIGFAFVLILWLVFRVAVEGAGLSRALAVGDAEKLMEISTKQLGRRKGDGARAPYLVYKALAHELRGEHAEAEATVREAKPMKEVHALLATSVHIIALVELGRAGEARPLVASELEPRATRVDRRLEPMAHHYAHLARARVLASEGKRTEANAELSKVIDDIRAGTALRARATNLRVVL